MNQNTNTIIAVIVVILVAGGLYYWYAVRSVATPMSGNGTEQSDTTALPSGSDTSDAALTQDMTSINGNIQASNSDSAAVDQGVNGY